MPHNHTKPVFTHEEDTDDARDATRFMWFALSTCILMLVAALLLASI